MFREAVSAPRAGFGRRQRVTLAGWCACQASGVLIRQSTASESPLKCFSFEIERR